MRRGHPFLTLALAVVVLTACDGSRDPSPPPRVSLQALFREAEPGDTVRLPEGLYLEDLDVPPGVSVRGAGADRTTIAGSIHLVAVGGRPVTLSELTLVPTGLRRRALVQLEGGYHDVHHCLLVGSGTGTTVRASRAEHVRLRNNVIVSSSGGYAVSSGDECVLEVVNDTIVVHGSGIAARGRSQAFVRNCLIYGDHASVVSGSGRCEVSHSNVFIARDDRIKGLPPEPGIAGLPCALFSENRTAWIPDPGGTPAIPWEPYGPRLLDPIRNNLIDERAEKERGKCEGPGVTFSPHSAVVSWDITDYHRAQPVHARHSGAPDDGDHNPDGTRNTLGAFGGPGGDWGALVSPAPWRPAVSLQERLDRAAPGETVQLPAGLFLEALEVPPGVSVRGAGADHTTILGRIALSPTEDHPVSLSELTMILSGWERGSLVDVRCGELDVFRCLLVAHGYAFATVNAVGADRVRLRNNVIVGNGYVVFGRYGVEYEIVNDTIVGGAVYFMDGCSAAVRNCLFCPGEGGTAVMRSASDYEITYCNVSLGRNDVFGSHVFERHDGVFGGDNYPGVAMQGSLLIPPLSPGVENREDEEPDPPTAGRDHEKYLSPGLLWAVESLRSFDVDVYRRSQPSFAYGRGCPDEADRNPDGTRNTLGAFGGPGGDW